MLILNGVSKEVIDGRVVIEEFVGEKKGSVEEESSERVKVGVG